MSSNVSASPSTARTAITRTSGRRCSTFRAQHGSPIGASSAIEARSMASPPSGKAHPWPVSPPGSRRLTSCVRPGIARVDVGIAYVGADIVPELVASLRERAAAEGSSRTYAVADLTRDILPRADAVLCQGCPVHLSFANGGPSSPTSGGSGAEWLVTTTPRTLAPAGVSDLTDGPVAGWQMMRRPEGAGRPAAGRAAS